MSNERSEAWKTIRVQDETVGVRWITIHRPDVLNALNSQVLSELKVALGDAASDTKVRVVVLTGEGDKAFIAGADISEMRGKSPEEGIRFARLGHEVAKALQLMPKPTIAAVNGFALGGGTEMAIACDFIVASEKAVFGQPEVGLGIIPGFGATFRLAEFVGLPRAKELIYSGRKVKADEALRIGLANHVLPAAGFRDAVSDIATEIAGKSFNAVSVSKKLMNELAEATGLNSKLDAEIQSFGRIFGTRDQIEGMTAFVEKRKPKFEGLER